MSFLFSRRGPKDVPLAQCATLTDIAPDTAGSEPPQSAGLEYDYVIVGAGTAGSVLANRLTQDGSSHVLLLERGTYMSDTLAKIPLLSAARAFQEYYTTAIQSEPQSGFGGRQSEIQVGRMVGGSSAINATVYSRGAHCEFDSWNLDGWRGADLDKYFAKSERVHAESDHGPLGPSRGTSGPWQIRITKPVLGFNEPFLTACNDIGIVRTPDPHAFENGEGPVATGVWSVQAAQTADGSRHHAGFAYLPEDVLRERSNLKLCVDAGVERVQLKEDANGKLKVEGVWIVQKGKVYYARAKRVILASGAIFSPCILQRSGLGPAPLLKSLSIPVLADMPGVGTNLTDHFLVPLHCSGPLEDSAYQMIRSTTALPTLVRNALTYWRTGRGLFATACTMESMSYFSSAEVEFVPAASPSSPSPGRIRIRSDDVRKRVPDIELTVSGVWADTKMPEYHGLGKRGVICFLVLLVKPESQGEVAITSHREAALPRVHQHFLEAEADLHALRVGIRVGMAVAAQMRHVIGYDVGPACVPGWEPMKGGWDEACLPTLATEKEGAALTPGFDFVDATKIPDATIDAFIRKHGFGAQHMASTCRMGPASSPGAVLDPATLEVHGTSGLSVCDGSIFPRVLSVHPSAAIVAVAEKYADELTRGTQA